MTRLVQQFQLQCCTLANIFIYLYESDEWSI